MSNLKQWREALNEHEAKSRLQDNLDKYSRPVFYLSEMQDLLEAGEVVEARNKALVHALSDPLQLRELMMRQNFEEAIRLYQKDCHHWSTRPCETCRNITGLLGFDFGCDAFRKLPKEQQNREHGGNY